ncbi:MAG: inosose dehydratase [Verrucomicrobia bacterium]|jgi:inosose dehydratase|nr:MAG: inosose dehydratase [Verrucomicrobiota bacterium]
MANIKFGSEVYTWFMQGTGAAYSNKLDHMIRIASLAGFKGIEPMVLTPFPDYWLGEFKDPARLKDTLEANEMELAGLALVCSWDAEGETAEEKAAADYAIQTLKLFPGAKLGTVPLPGGRHQLQERRLNLAKNVNRVSKRAKDAGIHATFHPNSPTSSIVRTQEDYDVVLNSLDPSVTGWTPDVGHIARGGMDVIATMTKWGHLVDHIHYKDFSGMAMGAEPWAKMGTGRIDFHAITEWLVTRNYDGWIICEDEAHEAVGDPDGVTLQNGEWCKNNLLPLLR